MKLKGFMGSRIAGDRMNHESSERGTCENSPNTVHLRNSKLSGTQMVSAGGALRS
jgi:hypothetical protein